MKKLLTVFVFVLFAVAVKAQSKAAPQSNTPPTNTATQAQSTHHNMQDCMMMENGKMMIRKGGKMMPMTNDMKTENGSTVTTKGEIITVDGKPLMTMKNGDCMDMHGNMMKPGKEMKEKSMKGNNPAQKKQAGTKED